MLHGPKKRTRVPDEESDNSMENGDIFEVLINVKNQGEENVNNIMQKDLKRMRLDLDHDTSRVAPSEFTNSSSGSSPKTPSSYTDTTEYTSSSYQYHQIHQHQHHKQQSLDDISLLSHNIHKLHRNPIRISTRSDASSSSSSTELLNPYMNINSVLYLANLTRTSHIVKELQDDLGCMEIDERVDTHRGQLIGNETSSLMEDDDSMNIGLDQHGGYVNSSEESEYQSINAVLREAFLRRHPNLSC